MSTFKHHCVLSAFHLTPELLVVRVPIHYPFAGQQLFFDFINPPFAQESTFAIITITLRCSHNSSGNNSYLILVSQHNQPA